LTTTISTKASIVGRRTGLVIGRPRGERGGGRRASGDPVLALWDEFCDPRPENTGLNRLRLAHEIEGELERDG
jgi:hypothetical protein